MPRPCDDCFSLPRTTKCAGFAPGQAWAFGVTSPPARLISNAFKCRSFPRAQDFWKLSTAPDPVFVFPGGLAQVPGRLWAGGTRALRGRRHVGPDDPRGSAPSRRRVAERLARRRPPAGDPLPRPLGVDPVRFLPRCHNRCVEMPVTRFCDHIGPRRCHMYRANEKKKRKFLFLSRC